MTDALCVFGGLSDREGETRPWGELSPVGVVPNGDGRKYYAPGQVSEGWCALRCERSGDWLRMSVDAAIVPYLGIWIDEGMVNDRNAIALEPSIGYYDRLERAIANGSAGVVQPGDVCEWTLEVRLGSGQTG